MFRQPNYVENFVQAILDSVEGREERPWWSAATARFLNREVVQTTLKIAAAANGFSRILVRRRPALDPGRLLRHPQARRDRRHRAVGEPQPGRTGG